MIRIQIENDIKPIELLDNKMDSGVFFRRRVYLLGIKLYEYACTKTVAQVEVFSGTRKRKQPGFNTRGGEE